MRIRLYDVVSANNGKDGVSLENMEEDLDLEIYRLTTDGNKRDGLGITKSSRIVIKPEQIGLPPDTSQNIINEAIDAISSNRDKNPTEVLSRTQLGKWIRQQGFNIVSITASIITILKEVLPSQS